MTGRSTRSKRLVVVGGGMVAHRLVEAMTDRDDAAKWHVDVFAEESRPPYDRVALTTFFSGNAVSFESELPSQISADVPTIAVLSISDP